jgi:hypothetical protein
MVGADSLPKTAVQRLLQAVAKVNETIAEQFANKPGTNLQAEAQACAMMARRVLACIGQTAVPTELVHMVGLC